jgi:hypothetical protein
MHRPAAIALLGLLAACGDAGPELATAVRDTLPGGIPRVMSPAPTGWADSADPRAWRLVPDGVFAGEPGTLAELIDPSALAVDAAGRIYVADRKPVVIKVFDTSGRFLHAIGREGEGPGEFRAPFIAVHGASLVVHDPQVSRTSVFDTAGTFVRSWPSSCCYWDEVAVDSSGLAYVPTARADTVRGSFRVRYALDGTPRDTMRLPEGPEPATWTFSGSSSGVRTMQMMMPVPLSATTARAYHPDGGMVYGFAQGYELVRTRTGSDSALVFGRAWTPEPLPDSVRQAAVAEQVERLGKDFSASAVNDAISQAEVPKIAPPYSEVSVDGSGNTWVRVGADDGRLPVRFDVFDSGGAWLGRVTVNAAIPRYGAVRWTADALYAVMEDEDGVPAIHRYRIERGSRK